MTEIEIQLTDAEWADAIRAAIAASNKARFDEDNEDGAEEIGTSAGIARAHEIARRKAGL